MVLFRYVAYSLDVGVIKGKLEANDLAEVRSEVVRQGYKVLSVDPQKPWPGLEEMFPSVFRVGTGELIRFCRSLATMMKSGGNLMRTLDMLQKDTNHRMMRRMLGEIQRTLDEGGSLSDALNEHPAVFSPVFVSMVEAGEHTGRLGPALDQLADILEKESEAKKKAIATMMYPAAIMGLAIVTMTILLLVALPPMLKVFENLDTDVPLITRIVVGVFSQIKANLLQIFLSMVVLIVVLASLARIPKIKRWFHTAQMRIPFVGVVVVSGELSRFSRTLSMLLESGVPLITAINLGITGCKNTVVRQAFIDAEQGLISGRRLADSLDNDPCLPTMFVELVMIGEESNSLQTTMQDAAVAYQKQMEQRLNTLLGIMEPASTLFVGAIVGLMAFSMFLPIYSGLDSFR